MLSEIKNYYLLLTSVFIICTAETCVKEKEIVPPPVPGFTYNPGKNGEIKFVNKSENAIAYQWDFGDGTFSTEQNPSHIYTEEKTYTVTLTANTKDQQKKTLQQIIVVDNLAPVPDFRYDILNNGKVRFTNISKYASVFLWDIEGQKQQIDKPEFEHQFKKNGTHNVTLSVEKKYELNASISKELVIENILSAADSLVQKYTGNFTIKSGNQTKIYTNFEINLEKLSDSTVIIKKIAVPEFSDENIVFQIKGIRISRLGPVFCEGFIDKAEGYISFCVIYTPFWVGFQGYKVK